MGKRQPSPTCSTHPGRHRGLSRRMRGNLEPVPDGAEHGEGKSPRTQAGQGKTPLQEVQTKNSGGRPRSSRKRRKFRRREVESAPSERAESGIDDARDAESAIEEGGLLLQPRARLVHGRVQRLVESLRVVVASVRVHAPDGLEEAAGVGLEVEHPGYPVVSPVAIATIPSRTSGCEGRSLDFVPLVEIEVSRTTTRDGARAAAGRS